MRLRPLRYLILTHVAAFATDHPGALAFSDAYLTALRVQTEALKHAGFAVTLAAPVRKRGQPVGPHTHAAAVDLGLNNFVALPAYRTMAQYLTSRAALQKVVAGAAKEADVVQVGVGGHPVAMAQAVWGTLDRYAAKRLLVFDDDPFPARQNHAASGRNPAKRYGKSVALQRLGKFCQAAIGEAGAVIAHSPALATRFAAVWNGHCHTLPPGLIHDVDLVTAKTPPSPRVLRVACFGREKATSGVDHVIEAVALARRLSAKLELDLIGDVMGSAPLMNLIREHRLESAVRLHGRLSDEKVRDVLDRCDVFVWPTLVPIVDQLIYGAAARGLPIVTYAGGPADVAIIAAGAGVVVPRGESAVMAEVLLALSRQHTEVRALSARALAWAKESTLESVYRRRAAVARQLCQVS